MAKKLTLLFFLVICFSIGVIAQDAGAQNSRRARPLTTAEAQNEMRAGTASINQKEYAAGFTHSKAACDAGALAGCYNLARIYQNGWGVAVDAAAAAQLYSQSCELNKLGGYLYGCINLGMMYAQGDGIARDEMRALQLFEAGCDAGIAAGCNNVGANLVKGKIVPQDKVRAATLFAKACDGGSQLGCQNLEAIQPGSLKVRQAGEDKLQQNLERSVPLLLRSKGRDLVAGSVKIASGTGRWRLVESFSYRDFDGTIKTAAYQAQDMGGVACIVELGRMIQICEEIPTTQAAADKLYLAARRGRDQEQARIASNATAESARNSGDQATIGAGTRVHRAGYPLSAEDMACFKAFSEPTISRVTTCTEYYSGGPLGPPECIHSEYRDVRGTSTYFKNVCKRTIEFEKLCGNFGFGSPEKVAPGERATPVVAPCSNVYR